MLRTYALSPDALRRSLRRSFWRFQWFVTLSFLAFGVFLVSTGAPVEWRLAGPMVGLIALVYFFLIFFNHRHQMRLLYSVRVDLDGSSITWRQMGEEPKRIMRGEITSVTERRDGLLIETSDARIHMLVPVGLARGGDEAVRETLAAWTKFEPLISQRSVDAYLMPTGLVASVLILMFANSLWVVVGLGLFLFFYGSLIERRLSKRPDVGVGTVRSYAFAFSFVIFILIMKSCMLAVAMAMQR